MHTGHLHLQGQMDKMSKSLKNTISIRDLLNEHSSDKFRVACLLSHYRSSIEFGPELLTAADAVLRKVNSFKDDVRIFISGLKVSGAIDQEKLTKLLEVCQREVHESLCDDFNTSRSVGSVLGLMSNVRKLMVDAEKEQQTSMGSDKMILQGIANFIDKTFATFGVGESKTQDSSDNLQLEGFVNSIVNVRNQIRLKAKAEKSKELFKVCDSLRDACKENQIEIKDHGNLSSWNKN